METPVVKKSKGISPIWILPLVALILGGWLIYKDYQESGFLISIEIKDANGLTPEKTKVMFKGLPVGTLKDFKVSPDLQSIIAEIEMVKQAREKVTVDTKFWVVRPEVSVDKITGLETLVKGSYFEIQPGIAEKLGDSFVALKEPPPLSERIPGLHLTLVSKHDVSLSGGSPVYFKKVEVGEIISNTLLQDGTVETKILIYPDFQHHVTTKSLFFLSSGIRLDASLPNISLQVDPLKTILLGGISFITPEGGKAIEDTQKPIPLYKDYKDFQESGFMITVQIRDANGLTPKKSKVMFKGLPVGTLKGFKVSPDLQSIIAEIEMVKPAREKLTVDTRFWVVRPKVSVNRITGLDTLVKGSYFEIQPGTAEELGKSFVALKEAPPLSVRVPGLHLTLVSKHDVSLSGGSPVYFKKVEVGEVTSNTLRKDGTVETKILIYPDYQHHVTTKSLFFISSGIRLDANLPKVSLQVDPLKTIFQGGISFITPEGGKPIKGTGKPIPLFKDYQTAEDADDIQISLTFSVDHGLMRGSEIRFNGVKIGSITDLSLDEDMKTVHATGTVHKGLAHLLRSSTYIWAVKARFNATGVSNLDALVSGPYLNLLPGSGKEIREFKVHDRRPVNMTVNTGLNLVLETDRLGSLGYDKPVSYRQIQVGHTTGYELSPTGQNVLVYINIHPPYVNLIRENTKFWNTGGIRVKGGLLSGIQISTESMAAIISGGISFSTPGEEEMGNRVSNGRHFVLHADPKDEWLNWSPALELGKFPDKMLEGSLKLTE